MAYTLFTSSYRVQPVTYRLGAEYTHLDVIRLFAKSHTLTLRYTIDVQFVYAVGIVHIYYDDIHKQLRLVDALYVIERLIISKYTLVEDTPTITNIIPELQTMIFSATQRTGTLQRLSKPIKLRTDPLVVELCKQPATLQELKKYILQSGVVIKVSSSKLTSTPTRITISTIHISTKGGWYDVITLPHYLDISALTLSNNIAGVIERIETLDNALAYINIAYLSYYSTFHVIQRRLSCNKDPYYAHKYIYQLILDRWNAVDKTSVIDIVTFLYERSLLDVTQAHIILSNTKEYRILRTLEKQLHTLLFSGNSIALATILPLVEKYITGVLAIFRTV